ncbi:hypothetical protein C1940_17405 (plasmid) [Lactiplantibacillus plantarum subsp. plantarum]|nr:hypothetical protein C1940_17405 [Lactiplantibacillus plantarum subsp. plantarum]
MKLGLIIHALINILISISIISAYCKLVCPRLYRLIVGPLYHRCDIVAKPHFKDEELFRAFQLLIKTLISFLILLILLPLVAVILKIPNMIIQNFLLLSLSGTAFAVFFVYFTYITRLINWENE